MTATRYFSHPSTLEELKEQYRRLAMENHPDHGGSTEAMQRINAEYREWFEVLKDTHRNKDGETYHTESAKSENPEAPEEFIEIIDHLLRYDGITVEMCGSWLWVSGDTRPVKDELKAMGFRFSGDKCAWYYHRGAYRKHGRNTKTLDEIRSMYENTTFTRGEQRRGGEVVPA